MSAAIPPVSDCGCSTSSSGGGGGGGGSGGGIYPLDGTANPNDAGVVPPSRLDLIWTYQQWLDPIAGPVLTTFTWNPNTLVWQ